MLSREELRGELFRKRRVFTFGRRHYPLCAICTQPLVHGGEIHESLITRGMIRDIDKAELILVPENSNLVHPECHPSSGRGSPEDFSKCCVNLLVCEKDGVMKWFDHIESELPIIVPQAKRDYLNGLWFANRKGTVAYFAKEMAPETYELLKELV